MISGRPKIRTLRNEGAGRSIGSGVAFCLLRPSDEPAEAGNRQSEFPDNEALVPWRKPQ